MQSIRLHLHPDSWHSINGNISQSMVRKLQVRIAKAAKYRNKPEHAKPVLKFLMGFFYEKASLDLLTDMALR